MQTLFLAAIILICIYVKWNTKYEARAIVWQNGNQVYSKYPQSVQWETKHVLSLLQQKIFSVINLLLVWMRWSNQAEGLQYWIVNCRSFIFAESSGWLNLCNQAIVWNCPLEPSKPPEPSDQTKQKEASQGHHRNKNQTRLFVGTSFISVQL